jgi:hypothetical protein
VRQVLSADPASAQDLVFEKGWGDGLPVVLPTIETIEGWERWLGVEDVAQAVICRIAPAMRRATVEAVIANCVMAGCHREDVPYVAAALKAVTLPEFNLRGIQATTHSSGYLVVIEESAEGEFPKGASAMGPGQPRLGPIGRALRLLLQNIGDSHPGIEDRSSQGSPAKYTFCVAADPDAWPGVEPSPNREVRVRVFSAEGPRNIHDASSTTAEGVLSTIAHTIATLGSNNVYFPLCDIPVFINPEHAETIAAEGWTKRAVAEYFFENARIPAAIVENGCYSIRVWPDWMERLHAEGRPTPLVLSPDNYRIYLLGGPGKHSSVVLGWGNHSTTSWPYTRSLRDYIEEAP